MRTRTVLIQPTIKYGDLSANLSHIESLTREAAEQYSPDVIILPEMWNVGFSLETARQFADHDSSPAASTIGKIAQKYGVNIVAGSVANVKGGNTYNTANVYNRNGDKVADYDKIHLFGLMNEGDHITAGKSRTCFKLDGITCGMIICYDLRFPELARSLALDGAQVLFVSAQWPHPRLHPWRTLLQARAIENQLYVIAVNCCGPGGPYRFFGHSMIVDPLGNILYECDEDEAVACHDIDLSLVTQVRANMNCLGDRVPEAYRL